MTTPRRVLVFLGVLLTIAALRMFISCGDPLAQPLTSCFDEASSVPRPPSPDPEARPSQMVPVTTTIPIADLAVPISGKPYFASEYDEPDVGLCRYNEHHTIEIAGEGAPVSGVPSTRTRFTWDATERALGPHQELHLVDGPLTVDKLALSWHGYATYVVRDAKGVALVVNGAHGAVDVPGLTVTHGGPRKIGATSCGAFVERAIEVSADGVTTSVGVGQRERIVLGGVPYDFHALASTTLVAWQCTDSFEALQWVLIRDESVAFAR